MSSNRFNEAAALHRGKQQQPVTQAPATPPASMRPRHYTAENAWAAPKPDFDPAASMRPRHYTAENSGKVERTPGPTAYLASMRPRHYTAENDLVRAVHAMVEAGFNEAAALHRGKPWMNMSMSPMTDSASMRPRHYTAENWLGNLFTRAPELLGLQ